MQSVRITKKNLDKLQQRLFITVEFNTGAEIITAKLPFAPDVTKEQVEWKLKMLAEEFDRSEQTSAQIQENVEVDVKNVTSPNDTAQNRWFADYTKLQDVQKLIDLGVLTGNEPGIFALKERVRTNFLPEYLNLI